MQTIKNLITNSETVLKFHEEWLKMLEEFSLESDIEMFSKNEINQLMDDKLKISKMNRKMLILNEIIINTNMSKLVLYKNVLNVDSDVIKLYEQLNQLNERIRKISEKITLKNMIG